MSGVQQRLKLKQTAIDTWSLREHLTLASAVLRSGDQNWVSVSRTMKQAGEPGRPQDWFSQKNCALQYNLLQEKFDIPRPKRGEKIEGGESPAEIIVKKLSVERMEELQKILEEEKAEILKLEEETELLSSDDITEEQLQKILREVEAEEAEEDRKEAQHAAWLASREAKKLEIQQALKTSYCVSKARVLGRADRMSQSEQSGSELDSAVDSPQVTDSLDSDQLDVEGVAPAPALSATARPPHHDQSSSSSSPLLTALLHSPTRTTIQSPPVSHFPTSPYKTPTITKQQPAVSNLSHKFSSTSTTSLSTVEPLIVSPSAVNTEPAAVNSVSSEANVTSRVSIVSMPTLPEDKSSSPKVEVPTADLAIFNAKPALETLSDEKFEETETENDAVEVMDTTEEDIEHGGHIEIGQGEVLFKSEDEDRTDILTDIDELLRDKLMEGELIPAVETEEEVEHEFSKVSTENDVSVDVMSNDSTVVEDCKEKEETIAKLKEEIIDVPEVIKLEDIDNDDSKCIETNLEAQTPPRGCGRPKIKSEFETLEPNVEELKTEDAEIEESQNKLLEHKMIVETKMHVHDSVPAIIAADDISEEVKTSSVDEKQTETVSKPKSPSSSIKTFQTVDITANTEAGVEPSNKTSIKTEKEEPEDVFVSNIVEVKPVSSFPGVDGVESVPCSPPTPCGSGSLTPIPRGPSTSTSSTPPSASTTSPAVTDEEMDYKMWKKSIILVWGQIAQHKNANLFAGAVSEADAPEYRDIVYRPMDLNSIKKNIESGHIKTTEGFERDLMLMFFNAIMYNSSDHEVYNLTRDMMEDAEKIVKDYTNTQALLKASEPKSLRGKSESGQTGSPVGVEGQHRSRGRSVSGTGGNSPVSRSGGQESGQGDRKKRERTVSMVEEMGGRGEKKRRKLDQ